MTLVPITFQPGIQKNVTEYLAEGGWIDCDKIRFREGVPVKLSGWVKDSTTQYEDSLVNTFTGVVRSAHSWSALDQSKYLVAGSHLKVELMTSGQIYDITPVRESPSLTDVITTTSGQSLVQITDVNHGLVVGDYVYVNSQAAAVDGITLSGSYIVNTVVDADNYKLDSGVTASGSTALAGGVLDIDYLLPSGYVDNTGLTGWSGGTWGTEGAGGAGWGLPRTAAGTIALRQWSFDEWGEDLVACVKGGGIYSWDKTSGPTTRLTTVTNAPLINTKIMVSQPSRFLIAFGSEVYSTSTFDPLIIRWAEQETLTGWAITGSNTAGEYRLPKGNRIITAVQTRSEILVFTDTTVYSMSYIGGTDIFRFTPLATNISILSQNSVIDQNGVVYWIGLDGIYMYNGVVQKLPCTVQRYLYDKESSGRINQAQKEKTNTGLNKEHNEIIWFYPNINNTEISNYVKYNYLENVFDIGTLARTAWVDSGVFEKPYGFDINGNLFSHENGNDENGAPMNSYITSGYFDIGDGDDIMFIDRIIPDLKLDTNKNIEITVYTKYYPHPNAKITTKGPYYFDDTDDKIDFRIRGRQMAIKYESNVTGGDFEIGKVRVNILQDGKR
jgi:hypothetical protein